VQIYKTKVRKLLECAKRVNEPRARKRAQANEKFRAWLRSLGIVE
jgi:hypothetical protein